jgi:NADH-quinone oxidoreductase subunit E
MTVHTGLIPPEARQRLQELLAHHPRKPGALLPALYLVQESCNHLSEEVLSELAGILEMPKSVIFEVVTFYSLYSTAPRGRNIIMVCQNLCCYLRGSDEVVEVISATLGIKPGETTADGRFTLRAVECLAACERAPAVMINGRTFGPVDPGAVRELLGTY